MLELNQLRYFVETAKTRNFTRAARNCHVAQPALSQQIRKLETLLGLKLLKRLPRGASLTPEGEVLLPYAQAVLTALQQAERIGAELRGVTRGTVSVLSLPSACVYVLPPRIAAFRQDHPLIDIVLEESVSANIGGMILSGQYDLGVTQAMVTMPGLARELLHEEELLLAVPAQHPLASRTRIDLSEAAKEPFVVTKRATEFRELAVQLCRAAGFEMRAAFETDHFDSIQAYCAVGMGVALIPKSAVLSTLTPAPKYLQITRPAAQRRLWLVWPQAGFKNKAAEAMVKYLLGR